MGPPSATQISAPAFLVEEKGLHRDDAYILCSLAMDLSVTQLVDGTKGIHAKVEKSIFQIGGDTGARNRSHA